MKKLFIGLLAIIFLMPCGITATALHDACKAGNLQEAKKLIGEGAEVNYRDKYSYTPLHRAADKGHKDVVKLLLVNGAMVDVTDNNGQSPLHWAADEGHAEVAGLLLKEGAKVDATDNYGSTPLHLAADKSNTEVVKELTAAPLLLNKSNNANSKLSKETLKKDDNSKDEFVRLFKELPEPALKSVAKSLFPVKDNDEPIIKALLKFSYQHLKENPEQQQSSFTQLFIREFYKNHLLELKLYIAIKNGDKETAIKIAQIDRKNNIANYLKKILDTQDYDSLDQGLKAKTESNYKQLVKYKKLA